MSLVGTRPPTVDEYEQYELGHRKRLAMKPGLTGMWQVSGRSDITDFDEVVAYDHCDILMNHKRTGQKIIFLNHGGGFKAPTGTPISYADETYTPSELFYYPASACWGCPIDKIFDLGFPMMR